ncbi:MAG: M67 family metallopeptidase [Telmatospirillum sp.]|nr:M67 family metallopeptidase [Telmatospirillum sp.]
MTAPTTLTISADDLTAIRAHAGAAYPEECCGLLVGVPSPGGGHDREAPARVVRVVPAANRAEHPTRFFEVDPAAHIAVLRALRGGPESIVGHYHSHPDGPAAPSARDRAQAMEEGAFWLIVATTADGGGDVTAWRAIRQADGTMDFEPVALAPDRPEATVGHGD